MLPVFTVSPDLDRRLQGKNLKKMFAWWQPVPFSSVHLGYFGGPIEAAFVRQLESMYLL